MNTNTIDILHDASDKLAMLKVYLLAQAQPANQNNQQALNGAACMVDELIDQLKRAETLSQP